LLLKLMEGTRVLHKLHCLAVNEKVAARKDNERNGDRVAKVWARELYTRDRPCGIADLPIPSVRGWAAHATSAMERRTEAECFADH
jgi:hypothetical protein